MEKAPFHHAFRVQYSGKVRQLITDCHIAFPTAIRTTPDVQFHKFKAIWDTGATNSIITESVIKQLSLQPTGKVKTSGVHGEEVVSTYIVDIGLPNHVVIANVQVSEGKLIGGKVDVLIGMDIIQAGDFAICNPDGKTVFSYCLPSHKNAIDLLEKSEKVNHNTKAQPALKPLLARAPKSDSVNPTSA